MRPVFIRMYYVLKELIPYWLSKGGHRKEVTELFPDPMSSKMPKDLPTKSRGMLFNKIEDCTGCGACEASCPTKCIVIESQPVTEINKNWISVFDVNTSRCLFCGLCVEVCPTGSLQHTPEYAMVSEKKENLIKSFGLGEISNEQRARWQRQRQKEEYR